MHARATWALPATGMPRAAKTLRVKAAEADAALPQRCATSLAMRPLAATCLPKCL